jgi:hypothetical protein
VRRYPDHACALIPSGNSPLPPLHLVANYGLLTTVMFMRKLHLRFDAIVDRPSLELGC